MSKVKCATCVHFDQESVNTGNCELKDESVLTNEACGEHQFPTKAK